MRLHSNVTEFISFVSKIQFSFKIMSLYVMQVNNEKDIIQANRGNLQNVLFQNIGLFQVKQFTILKRASSNKIKTFKFVMQTFFFVNQ